MEVLSPSRYRSRRSQQAIFVTFYSFKGGVGRTLALLNVACILAGLGRKVLMIDFDLEAPGLTLFQDQQGEAGISQEQPGLLDAVTDFLDNPWESPIGDGDDADFFDQYVGELPIPDGVQKLDGGRLDLVSAGRLDDDYEQTMYELSFSEMYEEGVGKPLFDRLKGLIRDSDRYDYVLIDSRTGFSDEGSITTRFLGDYLVVLTGLNRQNVSGTARFLARSGAADRGHRLALVASPVPMYYEDLRRERIESAKKRIREEAGIENPRFVTHIPYHPILALEEDPTVRSLVGTDLFEAYEELTEMVRDWAGDRTGERIGNAVRRLLNAEEGAETDIQSIGKEDPELVLSTFQNVVDAVLGEGDIDQAQRVFDSGLTVAQRYGNLQDEAEFAQRAGDWFLQKCYPREAQSAYKRSAKIYKQLVGTQEMAECYRSLGIISHMIGDVDNALRHLNEAGSLLRESGEQRRAVGVDIDIGAALLENRRVEEAVDQLEEAVQRAKKLDQLLELYGLGNLSVAYAKLGQTDEATHRISQAESIAVELDDNSSQAALIPDAIEVYSESTPEQALSRLHDYWDFVQEHALPYEREKTRVLRARLRLEVEGDVEGAAEDAREALDFYRERGVDSVWSREAESLLERAEEGMTD